MREVETVTDPLRKAGNTGEVAPRTGSRTGWTGRASGTSAGSRGDRPGPAHRRIRHLRCRRPRVRAWGVLPPPAARAARPGGRDVQRRSRRHPGGRDTQQRRGRHAALPARAGPAAGGSRSGAGRSLRAGRGRHGGLPLGGQHVRHRHAAVRDGATLVGVVCDESRWLAASGDICPVCGKPTRYAPDVLDELAAAVIEAGGSARQIAADLCQTSTRRRRSFGPAPAWSAPTCRLRSCMTPTRCGSYAGKAARSRLTEAR